MQKRRSKTSTIGSMSSPHYLFLSASAREPGIVGNTEWLAKEAARHLPAGTPQTWVHLAQEAIPPFVDIRHTAGTYPAPEGRMAQLLEATLQASHIVLVSPVYWFSLPTALKAYLDHWSGWLRVPDLAFKQRMAGKTLYIVSTGGERRKAQPSIDAAQLCAEFMGMQWGGALWGKGGAPDAVAQDHAAVAAAATFLAR